MEEKRAGTVHIDVSTFVDDLLAMSHKKQKELTREVGVNDSYFCNCKRTNNVNIPVFKYFCSMYKLDENKYLNPEQKQKEVPVVNVDLEAIVKVLTSIDSSLKELLRSAKSLSDETLQIHGKVANCNVNTYEIKKNLIELNKTLGVEKPKE